MKDLGSENEEQTLLSLKRLLGKCTFTGKGTEMIDGIQSSCFSSFNCFHSLIASS